MGVLKEAPSARRKSARLQARLKGRGVSLGLTSSQNAPDQAERRSPDVSGDEFQSLITWHATTQLPQLGAGAKFHPSSASEPAMPFLGSSDLVPAMLSDVDVVGMSMDGRPVLSGRMPGTMEEQVVFKSASVRTSPAIKWYDTETRAYLALQALNCPWIPRLYFSGLWFAGPSERNATRASKGGASPSSRSQQSGLHSLADADRVLITALAGAPLQSWSTDQAAAVQAVFDQLHTEYGSVHGQVAGRNILFDDAGKVWLIDLASAVIGTASSAMIAAEKAKLAEVTRRMTAR